MYLNFFSKTIYYSIFDSHLMYGCEVWGQNQNNALVQRLQKLQEKTVHLINFETNPNVVDQLLKDSNILKVSDFMKYKYALLIRNSLRKIFQHLVNSTLSLIRIMSITQRINKSDASSTTNSNYSLWGTFF